jgi:hypothetical protein
MHLYTCGFRGYTGRFRGYIGRFRGYTCEFRGGQAAPVGRTRFWLLFCYH